MVRKEPRGGGKTRRETDVKETAKVGGGGEFAHKQGCIGEEGRRKKKSGRIRKEVGRVSSPCPHYWVAK